MPYGGTTPAQDAKIDRCVIKLMADPKFKPQAGRTKKEAVIAVCKAQIMKSHNFTFYIEKASAVANKPMVIRGVASSTSIDRDNEQMSSQAVESMLKQIKSKKIPLYNEHGRKWNDRIGVVTNGEIDGSGNLVIEAELNGKHPIAKYLYEQIKNGVNLGFSVSGTVKGFVQQMRTDLGKFIRIFKDVVLDEVSVTDKASNWDSMGLVAKSWEYQIAKSISEDAWTASERTIMDDETTTADASGEDEAAADTTKGTDEETEVEKGKKMMDEDEMDHKPIKRMSRKSKEDMLKNFDSKVAALREEMVNKLGVNIAVKSVDPDGEEESKDDEFTFTKSKAFQTLKQLVNQLETPVKGGDVMAKAIHDVTNDRFERMEVTITKALTILQDLEKTVDILKSAPLKRKGVALSGETGDGVVITKRSKDGDEDTPVSASFADMYKQANS